MPLNDQLLQIERKSQNIWDTKSVLPVTFLSLVEPTHTIQNLKLRKFIIRIPKKIYIYKYRYIYVQWLLHFHFLAECEPKSLQDLCCSTIRCILRHNIEKENPHIKYPKIRPIRYNRKRRVQVLKSENTDWISEDEAMERDTESDEDDEDEEEDEEEDEDDDDDEVEEEDIINEENVEDIVSETTNENFPEATGSSAKVRQGKREKIDSGFGNDEDIDSIEYAPTVLAEAGSQCDDLSKHLARNNYQFQYLRKPSMYSVLMRQKILALPLPPTLKKFLNLLRDFWIIHYCDRKFYCLILLLLIDLN